MSKIPQEAIEAGARAIWERIEDEISFEKACKEKHPQIEWTIKDAEVCIEAADATRVQGVEVAVKPLEWSDNMAVTPFGSYTVAENIADKWEWTFHEYPYGQASDDTFDTIEEAKSAAQADYEQRIRSALTTPPAQAQGAEVEPLCHLVWRQGFFTVDDVVDYFEVARPGDKSVDGSDPFPVYTTPPAPQLTEREKVLEEVRLEAKLREHWVSFCDSDPFPSSDVFADEMEAAGFIEMAAVDEEDLESPFAAELGIERGGSIWKLTALGRAALADKAPSQTDRAEGGV